MRDALAWLKHFNIDQKSVPKQGDDGQQGSALYRCLKKGLLTSSDYLMWARDHFELPVLQDRFFKQPIVEELWYEVESYHNWSKEIVPVGKWDNVVYVACLQPVKVQTPDAINVVFLLASHGMVEAQYLKYKALRSDSRPKSSDAEMDALPDGFFDNEDTITKTSPNFPELPDEDGPTSFKDHETQVGQKVHEHTFVNVQLGKSTPLGGIAIKYFNRLKPMYKNILLLEPKGDKLMVTAWDPNWQPRTAPGDSLVPLDDPSIFRIVARSTKPYHGYVVANPVNEMFFDNWTGAIPEHVTITPIFFKKRMLGMLVAVGDKDIPQKQSLQEAEAIAQKISEKAVAKLSKAS